MKSALNLSLNDIGIISSVFPAVYGVAKLFGGVIADVNSPVGNLPLGFAATQCYVDNLTNICSRCISSFCASRISARGPVRCSRGYCGLQCSVCARQWQCILLLLDLGP
jgi:hypothetical protein